MIKADCCHAILSSVIAVIVFFSATVSAAAAKEEDSGAVVTLWPLFDYRESPRDGYSNLSILGPLFKLQHHGDDRELAVRPLFYQVSDRKENAVSTDYLYPLASKDTTPEVTSFQFLKLMQKNSYRKQDPAKREDGTMFFPFYISGKSAKYGTYTSVFPFYGDIYERFWRDEYHFVLFPLYGSTVNKGTTTRNYLYPFFSTITGERESGFQFWPLYGQSAKEGVYKKKFALWPVFFIQETGLDTDNPTHRLSVLPFYSATDSPKKVSRSYLWPFFGYSDDLVKDQHEVDYLWPFWLTVRGSTRNATRILPFYSEEQGKESLKRWYLWPVMKHEEINSSVYVEERNRILFFLFSDRSERWPKDGADRRKIALWPLFVYKRDTGGLRSFTFPALVEPILDRDGIEKNWAPLWRIYQQRWNEEGDSAVTFLWNLYWHEARGESLAFELFPLVQYRSDLSKKELKLLKGLIRYGNNHGERNLSFLWLPFGFNWGKADDADAVTAGEKMN